MSDVIEPVQGQQIPELENLKNNSSSKHGGARNGAGRKKGGMNYSTKQRLAIRKAFEDRIHSNAEKLLNAAMNKALGETYLMCQVTIGTGAKQRRETHIVTDPEIIRQYLDDELDYDQNTEYYYMSTKPVDMVAVKELYDRAFGKPLQKNELSGRDGEPLSLGLTPEQADQLLKLRAADATGTH